MIFELAIVLVSATVDGRVIDAQSRQPLAGCNVYLDGTTYGNASGTDGYYKIEQVPAGSYKLVFSMIGYKTVERSVEVSGDSRIHENAILELAAVNLPEVNVSSRRTEFENEVTASAFRINREALKRSPSMGEQDLFRTLLTLPGVTFTSDFTTALYVRGGSPDQNLVLLDNMVLYNPFHLGGFFSTFMLDAVDKVEFLTGGFPSSYGNRLSSVLSVESIEPEPLGGYASASLLATEGAIWGEKGSFGGLAAARLTYFDKIIPLFGISFPYQFADVHTVASWHPSSRTRLDATFFYTNDNLDLGAQDIPLGLGWSNYMASARLVQQFRDPWVAKLWLGWTRYDAAMHFSDLFDYSNSIDDISLRANIARVTETSTIETGTELSAYLFTYNVDADPFAVYNVEGYPLLGAAYCTWRWKPTPLFLFEAGGRFSMYYAFYPDTLKDSLSGEVISIDSTVHLDPEPELRLSAKYFLTADDAVNLSVGNYFQNLAMILPQGGRIPTNFWIPIYGKYEPQQSIHFIAGYEHMFRDGSRIRVEPYYKYNSYLLAFNEAGININDVDETMFAEGKGRSYGADFSIEKLTGSLTGWISYSLGFSRFISDTLEFYTAFDRRHSFNIVANYDLGKKWNVSAKWTFATGMPYAGTLGRVRVWFWDPIYQEWRYSWTTIEADYNTLRFPPYHRLDIGASKTWQFKWGSLTARADIINVYNQKNVMLYYYDMDSEPPTQQAVSMIPFFPSVGIETRF